MALTQAQVDLLQAEIEKISRDAEKYFTRVENALTNSRGYLSDSDLRSAVSDEDKDVFVPALSARLAKLVTSIMDSSTSSPLVSDMDRGDLRIALKRMRAGLRMRVYKLWPLEVAADEDQILGVEQPRQSEEDADSLEQAMDCFSEGLRTVQAVCDLILPREIDLPRANAKNSNSPIRPNTAFIMMRIDKNRPELEDLKNTVKDTFALFGIVAKRSDEIEHEGVITERILEEIRTSEFLFADLSGERPSVYYEVGYAHALERRPILYRSAKTKLHFDLSVHNCPEYKNLTDLAAKLQKRLEALTNKEPKSRASS
jgi:hypothetical protein